MVKKKKKKKALNQERKKEVAQKENVDRIPKNRQVQELVI
jgi:hypothetical protein